MSTYVEEPLVAATAPRGAASTGLITLCACLAQVMIVLDTTIIAVALPPLQQDLAFSDAGRQWSITGYTLAFGSLLLVGGRLSQRLGIRTAFLLGLIGFSLASFAGGFAGSYEVFVGARILQGAFAALLAPTNLSLMNMAFPVAAGRAKAFAIFGAVAGAGAALGLILGGILTDAGSWRWCFFVNVPLAVVTAALAGRFLGVAAGPIRGQGSGDLTGLALGTAGVFSIVFGFSRAEPDGWTARTTLLLLGGGAALLVLFLIRQRVARDPLLPLAILRNPVRASSYLSIAGVGLAQMGASVFLTYYFQNQLAYSPTRTGVSFLPMVGGLIVAAVVSTRVLVDRVGLRVVYPVGTGIQAIAFWLLTDIGPNSRWGSEMNLPLILSGMGLGLVMAPAMSWATAGVSARHSGLASACANTSQQLGASLGVAFLSTWAARSIADSISANYESLRQQTIRNLTDAGAIPGSPQAEQIIANAKSSAMGRFILEAYSSGFAVMAWIALGLSVITAALLWLSRTGGPKSSIEVSA